jgi:hypothetical protein
VSDVVYAIPSRSRADTLARKTLPLLDRLGIDRGRVNVFVADDERAAYREAVGRCNLLPGRTGMAAQRDAILDYFQPGIRVVHLDDDMRDLVVRRSEKTVEPVEADEWEEIVDLAYRSLSATGGRLWGLYPVPNPYFMRPRIRTDLTYIGGGLFGTIADPSPDSPLRVDLEDKEDFLRSLKCYAADGTVTRVEYVSWRTEGYAGAGGMQADGGRTDERIERSAREVARRFPDLASLNLTKKSGRAELRLRDRRPRVEA